MVLGGALVVDRGLLQAFQNKRKVCARGGASESYLWGLWCCNIIRYSFSCWISAFFWCPLIAGCHLGGQNLQEGLRRQRYCQEKPQRDWQQEHLASWDGRDTRRNISRILTPSFIWNIILMQSFFCHNFSLTDSLVESAAAKCSVCGSGQCGERVHDRFRVPSNHRLSGY